jgi:hypothetical protein
MQHLLPVACWAHALALKFLPSLAMADGFDWQLGKPGRNPKKKILQYW